LKTKAKFVIILAITLIFSTGCSEEPDNETVEPTRTPMRSPETDREVSDVPAPPCNHFWRLPDCHTPRYCLDCGEISEGSTPHEPTEANFQDRAYCTLCGDILGDVLEPNFSALGFSINTILGRSFDFQTVTFLDSEVETVGSAVLLFVNVFEYESGFPQVDGYEYVRARLMMTFDDESAAELGYRYILGHVDFYNMNLDDPALPINLLSESGIPGFMISNRTLNFHGVEREYFVKYDEIMTTWEDGSAVAIRELTFLIPTGYNGIILYLSSAANWADDDRVIGDNINESTLFFRLVS